jgi:hypothetical protein
MKAIFILGIAFALLIGMSGIVSAVSWDISQVTSTGTTEANVDIAVDSNDNVHRVYERSGKIYYSEGTGGEEYIADGTNPAIAVGPDNKPQVAFLSGGHWMYAKPVETGWDIHDGADNADTVDISVDQNNAAHVVYMRSGIDYYTRTAVVYATDKTGSWSEPSVLAQGWFCGGGGCYSGDYYYGTPNIETDSSNNVFIIYTHTMNGGDKWSPRYDELVFVKNSVQLGLGDIGGMQSQNLGRNAIAVDENGILHVIWNGGLSYATINTADSSWSGVITTGYGSSEAALDAKGSKTGISFLKDGTIYYTEDTGSGFSTPESVDTGAGVVVGLGSTDIDYVKDGDVYEAVLGKEHAPVYSCNWYEAKTDPFAPAYVTELADDVQTATYQDACHGGQLYTYTCGNDGKSALEITNCDYICENAACQPDPNDEEDPQCNRETSPPTLITGIVKDAQGNPVSDAAVSATCNGYGPESTTSDIEGNYLVIYDYCDCSYGNEVSVTAEKDGQKGTNNVPEWCLGDPENEGCPIDIALLDVSIPEFGIVLGGVALVGAFGAFLIMRKK